MIQASACGKVILCGEHAVVYGTPALALPLPQLRAVAEIREDGRPCSLLAPDLNLDLLVSPEQSHPLVTTVLSALGHFDSPLPAAQIKVSSQIPIGRGLGSGTAISAAIFRALANYFGRTVERAEEQAFIHQIETLYHGRPSGIDGAMIGHERALCFVRGQRPRFLELPTGWSLLIADSGETTPTHVMVNGLRQRRDADPQRYDPLIAAIGELCQQAEVCLKNNQMDQLGQLLNHNHDLLCQLGISTPRLDALVDAALAAGELGAKLSGGGGGGVLFAITQDRAQEIEAAWHEARVSDCWRIDY